MPSTCEIKRSLINSCINLNEQQQLHAKYILSFKYICNLQWKAEWAYGVNPAFFFKLDQLAAKPVADEKGLSGWK